MKEAELTCNSCKKRTALNSMKYAKDGSGLVCEDCLSRQLNNGVNVRAMNQPAEKAPVSTVEKKKVAYTCTSCGFKYSRALDFRAQSKICPNCGKGTTVHNLPNDAEKLLKELDEMDL